MSNSIFNEDFRDYLALLNKYNVEYMLVGGMAVNLHGYRRSTGDMDLFVKNTLENHSRLKRVHREFGMHMGEMENVDIFIDNTIYDVFTFGVSPCQIDIMTACKGIDFDTAARRSERINVEGLDVNLISGQDLIMAKQASNRKRDQADVEELRKINKV